jgi:hypothetical protein
MARSLRAGNVVPEAVDVSPDAQAREIAVAVPS